MNELRLCRYCGGKPRQYTREGRSFTGELGWISACYCMYCGAKVEAFNADPIEAERKAADWWNRGILDAREGIR